MEQGSDPVADEATRVDRSSATPGIDPSDGPPTEADAVRAEQGGESLPETVPDAYASAVRPGSPTGTTSPDGGDADDTTDHHPPQREELT